MPHRALSLLAGWALPVLGAALAIAQPAPRPARRAPVPPYRPRWGTGRSRWPAFPGTATSTSPAPTTGGIWKTEDAGLAWRPVFDDQEVHSIGALAVAASDPNVVWAGTGETFIRANVSIGKGVYRSTDAGGDVDPHGARRHRAQSAES